MIFPMVFPFFGVAMTTGLVLFGRSIGSLCALHLGILGYGEAPEVLGDDLPGLGYVKIAIENGHL